MTSELVAIAETSGAGRVVSVLEGGYQVSHPHQPSAPPFPSPLLPSPPLPPSPSSLTNPSHQVTGGPVSSLALAVASHVRVLLDPSLVGTSWSAADGTARLDASLAAERSWAEERARRREAASAAAAAAVAAAATAAAGGSTVSEAPAVGGEAAAAEQQDNGAPVKRSKRARVEVDYAAMAAKEDAEREAGGASGAV